MVWVPEWLKPRARRIVEPHKEVSADPEELGRDAYRSATNATRPVIDIVRPHLASGDCLIVTGYQDFLSSLAIILRELPDLPVRPEARIRIAFGVDTANSREMSGHGTPAGEAVRAHYLSRHGLCVEDAADRQAVLAIDTIRAGQIDLRVFDAAAARDVMGVTGDRRLHAKLVVSPLGSVSGSANFSRAGLYANIEFADAFECDAADGPSQAAATARMEAAELVWAASLDWNAEALEILEAFLRPVSAHDAAARLIHEQTSFAPWRIDGRMTWSRHAPFDHQSDLIYESSSIVYEHGFAFVESPTGSGKTEIGKYLGWTLPRTFEAVVGADHTGEVPRGGALVLAPPRVVGNWERHAPHTLKARPTSWLTRRRSGRPSLEDTQVASGLVDDTGTDLEITQYGVLIVDESHTMTPGFEKSSGRAAALEFAPPSWGVCLSATLLGNKDVDWLVHMKEKRASIFMSPDYLRRMGGLFERETRLGGMIEGHETAAALSPEAREELSDMLSPFVAHRQRACIGESADRSKLSEQARYPPFKLHPRSRFLGLSRRQEAAIDEIVALTDELAPGRRLTSVTTSRFGIRTEKRHNQNALYARNLLNLLRASSAHALWEMKHGAIGDTLRRFERQQRRQEGRDDPAQADFFDLMSPVPEADDRGRKDCAAPTPKCDRLAALLARPDVQRIDEKRYAEATRIQKRHARVVFLAERVETLMIFAEELARRTAVEGLDRTILVASAEARRSRRASPEDTDGAPLGATAPGYRLINDGAKIESYFRNGGRNTPAGPASLFLTYAMAEGINLQSADTLVLLGVTSNLKDLIQGLGRTDRVDSPHAQINYHLIDIPVGRIASDEKVTQRLENYRALSGRDRLERVDEAEGDTQAILGGVAAYLKEPRRLRNNNFHDLIADLKLSLDATRYKEIASLEITGQWGAELAILDGPTPMTLLHLRGEDGKLGAHSPFAPPRLVLIGPDGGVECNQIICAQALRRAYLETRKQGLDRIPPDRARIAQALDMLGSRIDGLTDWDLRPERTISLLQSLAVFLDGSPMAQTAHAAGGGEDPEGVVRERDEELFGTLSLEAIEYLCETWARELDPYWVLAKERVRARFAGAEAQSYTTIAHILQHLEEDMLGRERVFAVMSDALESARSIGTRSRVADRVSVAFVAPRHVTH